MKRTRLLRRCCLLLLMASVAFGASHSIDGVQANPSAVTTGLVTKVIVTASISDQDVIAAGVNLLSVAADGSVIKIIGPMHDDGLNGDATANDHIFSLQLNMDGSVSGNLYYRVSAAFKGSLTRVLSGVILVGVWNQTTLDNIPITFNAPPQWSIQPVPSNSSFRRVVSNVLHYSAISVSSLQNESQFEISIRQNANPQQLTVDNWFTSKSSTIAVPILSTATVTVSGQSALVVVLKEIQNRAHYYIARSNGDVIEIVFPLDQPNFLAEYQAMLQSLVLP